MNDSTGTGEGKVMMLCEPSARINFETCGIASPESLEVAAKVFAGLRKMTRMAKAKKCKARMEFGVRDDIAYWCFSAHFDKRGKNGERLDRAVSIERGNIPFALVGEIINRDINYLDNVFIDVNRWV